MISYSFVDRYNSNILLASWAPQHEQSCSQRSLVTSRLASERPGNITLIL